MDLFQMGFLEMVREGVPEDEIKLTDVVDRAFTIRQWLDKNPQKAAIFEGRKQTKNRFEKHYYKDLV